MSRTSLADSVSSDWPDIGISAPKPRPNALRRASIRSPLVNRQSSDSDHGAYEVATCALATCGCAVFPVMISSAKSAYAWAPRDAGSYSDTGRPWLGDSLRRTFRGITEEYTCCGKWRRTSSVTWCDRLLRVS